MTVTIDSSTDGGIVTVEPGGEDPLNPGEQSGEPAAGEVGIRTSRGTIAVALSTIAAGVVVGGVFQGTSPRIVACLAGLLGVLLGMAASRLRSAIAANLALLLGVAVIGVLMMLPDGASSIGHLGSNVHTAVHEGSFLRPPVPFIAGWHSIVGWLMAVVGAVAAWTALVVNRPTFGILLPLPLAVIAAVSIPDYAQIPTGVIVVVLFAGALGVVATGQLVGGEDQRPSASFQIRRALRGLVVVAIISGGLVGLAQTNLLFPKSVYNPATKAQQPHKEPPTNAPNRPLFLVNSKSLGPYRTGDLDVYADNEWLYAPLDSAPLTPVSSSGVVDSTRAGGVSASITMQGYTGAVLPTLGNPVGIRASGPSLDYQARTGLFSIADGQVARGYQYTVESASLPTVQQLEQDSTPIPLAEQQFEAATPPTPAMKALLLKLRKSNKWDTFLAIRSYALNTVTATGSGVPTPVSPAKVQDMMLGSKKGSPFQITAAIALMSRWSQIPARLGYGFQADPTDKQGADYVITPTDAISYPEVYFTGYGWLPVTGTPKHAAANDSNSLSKTSQTTLPSNQFGTKIYVPNETPAPTHTTRDVLIGIGIAIGVALLIYLSYLLAPLLIKYRRRQRLRKLARAAGPRSRLTLAYAEWRDAVTDFGYRYDSDTPLAFLEHFPADDEHTELAWLATRAIWGDLRDDVTDDMAQHCEELSRALRRRLAASHPATLRLISALSRLSIRHPYAPDLYDRLTQETPDAAVLV